VLTQGSAEAEDVAPLVVDYLKQAHDRPFFMSIGLTETHTPYPPAEPAMYPAEDARYTIPPRPFPDTPRLRAMAADFKHSARRMDEAWGVILDALDETGLATNTVVFCFADHGLQWPLHIANVGEHGNAAYLVIRGQNALSGGKVVDAMVSLMDLFPTVCDVVGLDEPAWLQGRSLLPLISGKTDRLHEELYFEQTYHAAYEPMRAVRTERYIYIKRFEGRDQLVLPNTDNTPAKEALLDAGWQQEPRPQEMLYDVYFDPDQMNNLIDNAAKQEIVCDLRASLERWMDETDDPLRHGPVSLPPGVMSTDPDAYSPEAQPLLVGD
jgi:arylsulfatase A-like enzyme